MVDVAEGAVVRGTGAGSDRQESGRGAPAMSFRVQLAHVPVLSVMLSIRGDQVDASSLASAVVQTMSAVASGQLVQEGAQRVYNLVRERMMRSDLGKLVLEQFEAQPTEPSQQEILRSVLTEAISNDSNFAQQLQDTESAYTATQGTRSSVGGNQDNVSVTNVSQVRGRNQISIGPMTVTNNRQTRISFAAIAIALVFLLGFGTYGAANLIIGTNRQRSDGSSAAGRPAGAQPTRDSNHETPAPKILQEAVDISGTIEGDKQEESSHFDVQVEFGPPAQDYFSCGFAPLPGTTVVPLAINIRNRAPVSQFLNARIVPLGSGVQLYQVVASSSGTCMINRFLSGGIEDLSGFPEAQQQRLYHYALVGVPPGALSSNGVDITFSIENTALKSDSSPPPPPPASKTVHATIQ